jgi:hypothetical protein
MANDKKFIVKHGLLTGENAVLGDTLDRDTGRLQVRHASGKDAARFDGRVIFDHDIASQGAIEVVNDATNGIIAKFTGTGGDLRLTGIGTGDYFLAQSNQNNGIKFYDGNDGVEILYSNSVDLEFDSSGIDFKREPTVNGDVIWYAGNDGSGSGLDADLLDGIDSLSFVRSDQSDTMDGSYIITGDLTVNGNTTYINTEQLLVSDAIFTLNADFTSGTPSEDAGFEIRRGDQANSSLYWDETADEFKLISAGTNLGRIITEQDQASQGGSFDAATLDGLDSTQFLRSDVDDTASGNITFDGDIIIDQQIIHKGDTDTYLDFNAADSFQVVTGGTARLTVANAAVTSAVDLIAPRLLDSGNNSYLVDPAGTSVLNRIDLDDYIRHNGDTDTYMGFSAGDTIDFYAGGSQRARINSTVSTFYSDIQADRFVDRQDTNYFANPADSSVFNSLGIDDELFHNGDADTRLLFADNDISLQTGGAERLGIDNTSVRSSVNVYAPVYYDSGNNAYYGDFDSISQMNGIDIDAYIRHRGNTTAYFGFPSNNVFRVYTNNIQRFNVDNDSADFSVNVYAPRYYDSNDTNYYVDPAGDSQMDTIDINDYVRHRGDTNTYIGFDAADQFVVYTGGTRRLRINNSGVLFANQVEAPSLSISDYIYHTGDTNTYLGFDTTDSITFVTNGSEKLGIDTDSIETTVNFGVNKVPTAALSVQTAATMGNNPYAAGNVFVDFGDAGVTDFSIRGTASARDIWMVHEGNGDILFADTGATITLGINTGTADVVIGDQSPQYTDGGDNTALTTTPSNAKLHVNGSIYLNGSNDGIIFGRGTASFLKDEELAFGWGGGLYMTDGTYLRIRNNKAVYSTGDYYGSRFYAQAATGYYLDPDSDSILHAIGIDDRIFHNGDTNTFMEFDAADNFRIVTNNAERLDINNTRVLANNQMHSPIFYDSNNTAYYGDFNSTSNMSRIDIDDYIRHRGDTNTYVGFNSNDTFSIYTNGVQRVQTNATQTKIRQQAFIYGPQTSAGDALLIQSNGNGSGVNIRMTDNNNGEGTYSQSGSIEYYHSDNAINPDSNAAFYFRTTEPKSHFIFGSDSDGSGTTAANYVAVVPDVNNVGWLGRADRRWANVYGATGNFSGNMTAANMYASRYYDADNNAYYGDFASTSIMNTVQANRYYVRGSTYFIDQSSSDYGTIRVEGQKNGWAGYAIYDDWVFMSNGLSNAGIFNDSRNEWALQATDNSWTRLYANGIHQISAENGYGFAPSSMRSPIFYDSNNTAYFGDFASRSKFNTLELGNQGNLTGSTTYPLGIYHNTRYSIGFRNSGAGANYIWLVHDNYNFNGTGSKDAFIVHFNGIGDRLRLDEAGNMLIDGEMAASNFNLNGGNENISLNPAYGSGMADDVLFDGTKYWESRVTQPMQGAEDLSHQTGEYVKNNNGPFASTYALRLNRYEVFDSDYIEVEPGEEIYGECAVRYISGSGGVVYMGIRRYDKDKRPIAGNSGITYFVVGGNNYTGTGWQVFSGHTTIPTSHTPYSGSDGGGCKYIRLIYLMNYPSGGGPATREYGPPILKRANVHSNVRTNNNMFAARYYDSNNTGFYVDPASTSIMNRIDASSFYDRDNTTYYMNPASGGKLAGSWDWTNGSIENLNNLSFNDPGPQEGIRWKGGNEWKIYESPDNLSTNSGGNLQFTSGSGAGTMRFRINTSGDTITQRYSYAQRFYDLNNGNYYLDPDGTSIIRRLKSNTTGSSSGTRALTIKDQGQGEINFGSYPGAWTSALQIQNNDNTDMIWISPLQNGTSARFRTAGSGLDFYTDGTTGNAGTFSLFVGSGYAQSNGSLRAPIFYDSNDTGYYVDPNGTSRMEKIRFEGTDEAIELNSGNPYIRWMENGTDRFYIQWRGSYDAPLFRNQQGDNFDFMPDGNGGGVALRMKGADDDIWGYVYASDSQDIGFLDDQGQWAIRHNRDDWTYFYINNSLRAYVDTGSFQHVTSIRSPIFYDRDDTAYYADMNNTSIFNYHRVNRLEIDGSGRYIDSPTGNYGSIRVEGASGGWAGYAIRDDWVFMSNGSPAAGIYNDTDNEWALYAERNARVYTYYNGQWEERTAPGYMEARGSYRAPIFYDSNDTNYYLDPRSTSRLNNLNIIGTLNVNGYDQNNPQQGQWYSRSAYNWNGSQLRYYYVRVAQLSSSSSIGLIEYYAKRDSNYPGAVRGSVHMATYAGSSMSIQHDQHGSDGQMTPEVYIDNNRYVYLRMSGCAWNSVFRWRWVYRSGQTVLNDQGGLSQPSNSRRIIAGKSYRMAWGNQASLTHDYDSPNIANRFDAHNSMRAPIFYDSNNTGYYVDPNSTSQLYRLDVNNQLRFESGAPAYFYTSSGNLRGYIRATESNDNHFEFATSGGEDIIFRDGGFGGSWNQIIRGDGQVLISSRLDTPIMYDRNNTGYYVDPEGFSNMGSGIRATEIYARNWFRNDNSGEGLYNQATAMHWYSDSNRRFRLYSTQSTSEIMFTTSGNNVRGYVYADNSNQIGFLGQNGSWSLRTTNGIVYSHRNFYAPIMYDTNDTSYYVDPNGTSRMRRINLTEELQLYSTDLIVNTIKFRTRSGGTSSDPYMLRFVERSSNQVHLELQLNDDADEDFRIYGYSCAGYGCGETSNNLYHIFRSNGYAYHQNYLEVNNSVRSALFYDINNTGYYTNQASTSRHNAQEFVGNVVINGYFSYNAYNQRTGARLLFGGGNSDALGNYYIGTNLNNYNGNYNKLDLRWHTGIRIGAQAVYGGIRMYTTEDLGTEAFSVARGDNNVRVNYSLYAQIMYDSNNTGYYVNPSDFSNFANGLRVNEVYARNWFRNDNSGEGIYNQATGQHFYSDDDDGWNVAGGSGANWIRFRDEYAGSIRGYVYADNGSNIGFLNSGGSWRLRIVGNDYMLYYGSSIRAPIFYDSNNTTYRFNGASDNDTRFRGVHNETMAFMALSGQTRSSAQYYMARPRITGDGNYWTGAMGWSRVDMNTVGNWGSGFIDSWSNPGNQPSGTSHWVGVQAYHYTNGSARYGWQLVGGPIDNLRFRNSWSSFRSWRTVPVLDINNGNGGSMYAGRYYDSNNTGYYADPASTSQFNSLRSFDVRNWYGVSTNHTYGIFFDNGRSQAYAFFRESGGWSYPYPDTRVVFHTGLKFGANASYEGMRFYTDYNVSSLVWQFNGGSNYSYQYRWNNLTGYHGIYSSLNGAHFYPNNASYGSWRVQGSRNGWGGMQFDNNICLMMNQTVHGFYSTQYGWRLYLDGSVYTPGNVVAYWSDARLKKNITELERGEGLEKIMALKPSRFNWKDEAEQITQGVIKGGKEEVSVIAQETEEVIPDAVVINKAGGGKNRVTVDGEEIKDYLTVNYDKITPFLIQAVKDLKSELDDMKDLVAELREELRQERSK